MKSYETTIERRGADLQEKKGRHHHTDGCHAKQEKISLAIYLSARG
ncbi:hypothetical protein ACXEO8_08275 [Cytobacillus firmus]|nr:hypothetical protein [Bacillus sp. 22-7]